MGLFHLGEPAWALIVRSAAIYLVLLLGLRVFGKREVGQFTLFDLVFVLLVANAVQPAMTGKDLSLGGGFIIIATLLTLNFTVARLRIRFPVIERALESKSVVVARDGAWIDGKLKHEGITAEEALAALREHGIDAVDQTKMVVLEADGGAGGRRRRARTAALARLLPGRGAAGAESRGGPAGRARGRAAGAGRHARLPPPAPASGSAHGGQRGGERRGAGGGTSAQE